MPYKDPAKKKAHDVIYGAAYKASHKEGIAAVDAAYRATHKKEAAIRSAAWYVAHKEERVAYSAAWQEAHREDQAAWHATYETAHPEKRRAANARRRVRVKVSMTAEDRELSVDYRKAIANDPCFYCGAPGEHDDHYVSLFNGGTDHWWNLVRACALCNHRKNKKNGDEFIALLVRPTTGRPSS